MDEDGDGTVDRGERYVYDGEDIALVFDGAGSLKNRYLHGPGIDEVFADENALGEILWALSDNQGTIRDVTKYDAGTNTTSVVNHLKYDAFGKTTEQLDATYEPRFTYTGREGDADAGGYYYRTRWYGPDIDQFWSEDWIGFAAGDANLRRYVGNRPTNYTDPFGLKIIKARGAVITECGPVITGYQYLYLPSTWNGDQGYAVSRALGPKWSPTEMSADEQALARAAGTRPSDQRAMAMLLNAIEATGEVQYGTNTCERWALRCEQNLGLRGWINVGHSFTTEIAVWEIGGLLSPRHAAVKVSFSDGTAMYIDNGALGGSDHILSSDDIPAGWTPR